MLVRKNKKIIFFMRNQDFFMKVNRQNQDFFNFLHVEFVLTSKFDLFTKPEVITNIV